MIVAYIDERRATFGVEPICQVLTAAGTKIAPSTYCAAETRQPSVRALRDLRTSALIALIYRKNYSVKGARKVHVKRNVRGIASRPAPFRV